MTKPITIDDLKAYLEYVHAHEHLYDSLNVAMTETVIGGLLAFLGGES